MHSTKRPLIAVESTLAMQYCCKWLFDEETQVFVEASFMSLDIFYKHSSPTNICDKKQPPRFASNNEKEIPSFRNEKWKLQFC